MGGYFPWGPGTAGRNPNRPESQDSPEDAGSRYHTDDTNRHVMPFEGRNYVVFEAYPDYEGGRVHDLPAGAMVIAYATDPDHCYALVDTDGDGKPNMVTWDPSPDQFRKWVELGQVSPELIPTDMGRYDGGDPDGVESSYGSAAKGHPVVTGDQEGGTFGDGTVVYDHAAMTQFRADVDAAAARFETGSGGVTALATVGVEPGQTPQAQKLRELFNLPAGRATDWFDTHVFELPQNLKAMTDAVDAASTKVEGSDTEMEISAKALADAMDAGSGAGSSTDIGYDDI